jgi:O-antigen/teichoic acid export membrane protein
MVLSYSCDGIIAVMTLGPAQATPFIVVTRLLTACQAAVTIITLPFWPAYGEALARNDMQWIRRALLRATVVTSIITFPSGIAFAAFGPSLTSWWTGGAAEAPQAVFTAVGVWLIVWSLGAAVSAYLNTELLLGRYAIMMCAFALSSLALKILVAKSLGAPGIIWAGTVCYAVAVLAPCAVLLRRNLRERASYATAHGAPP